MKRFIAFLILLSLVTCVSCSGTDNKVPDTFCVTLPDGVVIFPGESISVLDSSAFLKNERKATYEATTCLEDAKEYSYVYEGLTVTADSSKIVSVRISSDAYATAAGVHVGMTLSELISVCGEGTDRGEFILYKKGSRSAMFYIENGSIAAITVK